MEEKNINKLMSRFVQEVKRKDGNPYPPSTLVRLVSGIQQYLRENGRAAVSFFDEKDATYDILRKSVDAKMKTLAKEGIGCRIKQAQPITPEMEHLLWQNNTLGRLTGESLTNTVFWYSCKMFSLRAADEHRKLDVSQFTIGTDINGKFLRFTGRTCKNWQGGLHHLKLTAKDLKIYAKVEL